MANSRKKSAARKPKRSLRDVAFVELPCDDFKVYEASIGGKGGTDPTERPVLLIGPAADIRMIVTKLRKLQ